MHYVKENQRNNNNKTHTQKRQFSDSNPLTFPCKKTWLSLVRKTLPMPPPVLPLCVLIANANKLVYINYVTQIRYNSFLVYCRELAPGTVSLTDDRAQGDGVQDNSAQNQLGPCQLGPYKTRPMPTRPKMQNLAHANSAQFKYPSHILEELRYLTAIFAPSR